MTNMTRYDYSSSSSTRAHESMSDRKVSRMQNGKVKMLGRMRKGMMTTRKMRGRAYVSRAFR